MSAAAIALLPDDDRRDLVRWGLAGAIVLAAHLGLIASYVLLRSPQLAGVPSAPAIILELSPMPASPQSAKDVDHGSLTQEAQPEPQVAELPPPVIELPPPPPVPVEPPVVLLQEPPPPEVKLEEKPVEPPPEPKKLEEKKPAPIRATAPPRAVRQAPRPVAAIVGNPEARAAKVNWGALIAARLQDVKRYPSGAESRREQGVVTLSLSISRSGAVLSRSIARSSGYSDLDQEVLAMVQRAAPFPPAPAGISEASQQFTVPVRFAVR